MSTRPLDKWEGEDDDDGKDNVKDNWEDDDDEQPAAAATEATPVVVPAKNKGKTKSKIFEKERREEMERLAKLTIKTPEEIAAEKARLEKLQEAAEIKGIQEAFGSTEVNSLDPQTKDDFDDLRKRLVADLTRLEKRALFGDFLEDFIQDLCLFLPSRQLKKVKTSVEALYFEKSKSEKASAGKASTGKSAGVKGKAKLVVEGDRAMLNPYGGEDMDDFEDFM